MAQPLAQPYYEIPEILNPLEKELGMAAAADPHALMAKVLLYFLDNAVKGSDLFVMLDVFRYLDDEVLGRFGDFRSRANIEAFVERCRRFGANDEFVQNKLEAFTATGKPQNVYAADLHVSSKKEAKNRFAIPLLTIEITSPASYEDDLFYLPAYYELIGVKEYFIFDATFEQGTLLKGYRVVGDPPKFRLYKEISPEAAGYFSEVLNRHLPINWELWQ
jgi:hypothetical protein